MKVHHVSTSLPKCISPKFGKPCTVAVGNAELASCMKGRAFSKSADSRNGLCPFIRCRYLCLVSILSGLLCHRASASFSSLNLRPSIGQKASSRSAEKRGRERERETVLAHTTARYDASTRQERERERRYWRTPQLGMTRRQGKYLAIPKWNRRVALCNLASSKCQKKGVLLQHLAVAAAAPLSAAAAPLHGLNSVVLLYVEGTE